MDPTPFMEANALLAVIEGDDDKARKHVEQLSEREARDLIIQCDKLGELCRTHVLKLMGSPDVRSLTSDGR